MTTKILHYSSWFVVIFLLVTCGRQSTLQTEAVYPTPFQLTQTPIPPPTSIPVSVLNLITPSPLPTPLSIPIFTPDSIQVEKWREYQEELAKLVLSDSGADFPNYKDALCEWDILGRSGQEVYVWAICSTYNSGDRRPAVIYLNEDGAIQDVKVVSHGSSWESRIRELFPADVQEKIALYISLSQRNSGRVNDLRLHLLYRVYHPEEPPLIILNTRESQ